MGFVELKLLLVAFLLTLLGFALSRRHRGVCIMGGKAVASRPGYRRVERTRSVWRRSRPRKTAIQYRVRRIPGRGAATCAGLLGVLLTLAIATIMAWADAPLAVASTPTGPSPAQQVGQPTVSVFPQPGTTTLMPRSQLSFRGAALASVPDLKVVGSSSGPHLGRWVAHSDHAGASFVPDRAFTPGETVTVTTSKPVAGAQNGQFEYKVAHPVAGRQSPPTLTDPPATNGTRGSAPAPGAAPAATASLAQPPTPSGPAGPYYSRPDLSPPKINTTVGSAVAPGLLLGTSNIASNGVQNGTMIFDNQGQPVWFNPTNYPFNLQETTYQGKTALAYFQPQASPFPGDNVGVGTVLDQAYRQIGTIQAGNGYQMNEHDFQISPDGTKALMTIYAPVQMDLSPYGGPQNGVVLEGVVQEVDIATGAVTFEWHSLGSGAFPVTDSYVSLQNSPVDYFHLNSVAYDKDGNYLLTARHTSVVTKLNSSTGDVLWRMGGKRNQINFTDGDGGPSWPHDVRREPNGTIGVYDNGNSRQPPNSRGVDWSVNETNLTANVAVQWLHDPSLFGAYTGSKRTQDNGNQLIDWANTGAVTEYAPPVNGQPGQPVFQAQLPQGDWSYRVLRADWHATPARPPDAAVVRSATTPKIATGYASWNGATEVATWQLWGGPDSRHLRPLGSAPRNGFETKVSGPVQDTDQVFQVQAVNSTGQTIGSSAVTAAAPIPVGAGVATSPQFGIPDQTDVFDVNNDGAVEVRWVNGGGAWNGPMAISPPGTAPPGAQLAASNQFGAPDQTDVFVVGNDGATRVSWVDGGGSWNGPQSITPSGTAPAGAALAASNQFGIPDQTDVFAVGNDGASRVSWVVGGGQWQGPQAVAPAGTSPPGAGIAASNQFGLPNQTDLFSVGTDGATRVSWVAGGGAWGGPMPITPAGSFPAGAPLAASNQFGLANQTDVFATGGDGAARVSWVAGGGIWGGPMSITPAGSFPAGAPLSASNQFGLPSQTDVFGVGGDGGSRVSWVAGGGSWGGPMQITPSGTAPAGAPLAASNQFGLSDQTDVFVVGNDGGSRVSWVDGGGPWQGPWGT
jgi:hypothetical protein